MAAERLCRGERQTVVDPGRAACDAVFNRVIMFDIGPTDRARKAEPAAIHPRHGIIDVVETDGRQGGAELVFIDDPHVVATTCQNGG